MHSQYNAEPLFCLARIATSTREFALAHFADLGASICPFASSNDAETPSPHPARSCAASSDSAFHYVFEMGIGTNFADVPFNMGPCGTPGASLRGWRRYFPNAAIFGGDVDGRVLFKAPRITTFKVDQTAPESIHKVWSLLPDVRFDLIIDDGLHSYNGNTTFVKNSHHRLSDNRFHVIEDIAINEANLQQFHLFFRDSGLHGFLIRIPHSTNREDN